MNRRFGREAMVGLLAATMAACAGAPSTGASSPSGASPSATSRPAYTAADAAFMAGMIHHHAQAVVMAGWAPTHDARASLRAFCERIAVGQQDEIRTMQTWLRDHGEPVPEPNPAGMSMTMNGTEHVMLMPGMLTAEQMRQLDQSRGPKFDSLFLTYMIMHHQGAITMVDELFGSYGAAQDDAIYKFASDIYADQSIEIERMQQMLAGRTPPDGGSPPAER